MQKVEIKSTLKCCYFGFRRSSHDFFETCCALPDWQLIAADFIALLEMNYTKDGDFCVYLRVIKDKEKKFRHKFKTFYSGIDALVCYEGWITDARNEFHEASK